MQAHFHRPSPLRSVQLLLYSLRWQSEIPCHFKSIAVGSEYRNEDDCDYGIAR